MKVIFVTLCLSIGAAVGQLPETLNVEGAVYAGVTFQRADPERVYFLHETGAAAVEIRRLSTDLQLALGYDEAEASAFRAEVAQRNAESAAAREATADRLAASVAREKNKREFEAATVLLRGVVSQVLDEGAIVDCVRDPFEYNAGSYLTPRKAIAYKGDFEGRAFIRGLTRAADKDRVEVKAARMADNFQYNTVLGARKTVAQFLLVE